MISNEQCVQDKSVSEGDEEQLVATEKVSVISVVCRICYDNEKNEELIAPCHCKGTVAFVHRSCLETWLAESNSTTCELCHQTFKTERTPRYSTTVSIWYWLRKGRRNFGGGDIMSCTILTPLAVIITYICLYSAEYYSQKKFINVPAARWTSISLLFMIGVMLLGYYLWVYSVVRMHARMWYNWWQRSCDVRYIAPSTISLNVRDFDCPEVQQVASNTLIQQDGNSSGAKYDDDSGSNEASQNVGAGEKTQGNTRSSTVILIDDTACSSQDSTYLK